MEEAVEICKLRLFLKLIAQVDNEGQIEPLPDIDFNIRAGNTLVGYATSDEVRKAMKKEQSAQMLLLYKEDLACFERFNQKMEDLEKLFALFRRQQTELGGEIVPDDKKVLRERLKSLENELNIYLAKEYGVDVKRCAIYEKWLASHKPFHWFIEFYGIFKKGGFDVIIGNPPYVEYSRVRQDYAIRDYKTESCGNLYAYVIERCLDIIISRGYFGMIVQLPIVCTDRMKPLQDECLSKSTAIWFATFDDRPAKLFDGLEHIRASIVTLKKGLTNSNSIYSTTYNRWYSEARQALFQLLSFESVSDYLMRGSIPKIGYPTAKLVRQRIAEFSPLGKHLLASVRHSVYFHNAPQYWIRAMTFIPYFWNEHDGEQVSTQVKTLNLSTKLDAVVATAILNSTLFYWWFVVLSDCRHLNLREIENFPIGLERMSENTKSRLSELSSEFMADLKKHQQRKEAEYKATGKVVYDEFYPKYSKSIIDKIDHVLAQHYGFTDEELDFVINYDIKYRMGAENEADAEE